MAIIRTPVDDPASRFEIAASRLKSDDPHGPGEADDMARLDEVRAGLDEAETLVRQARIQMVAVQAELRLWLGGPEDSAPEPP